MEIWLKSESIQWVSEPLVISPVPECIILVDILRNWQNSYIGSLTCGGGLLWLERLN